MYFEHGIQTAAVQWLIGPAILYFPIQSLPSVTTNAVIQIRLVLFERYDEKYVIVTHVNNKQRRNIRKERTLVLKEY